MKILFAPHYLNQTIQSSLLSKQNQEVLFNVWSLPFESWLESKINAESSLTLELKFYKLLQPLATDFPLYGPMFRYPAFCNQLFTFTKEALLYQLDFKTLPNQSAQEKELQKCLALCATLDHKEKKLASLTPNFEELDQATFYPTYFSSMFYLRLSNQALTHQVKSYPTTQASTITYRSALNPRQEIEGIAQEIITNQYHASDINLVVTDDYYLSLVEDVFTHYQLPVSYATKNSPNPYTQKIIKGILFCVNKDLDSLLSLLKEDFFSTPCTASVLNYVTQFILTLDNFLNFTPQFTDITNTILINQYELAQVKKLESEFVLFKNTIQDEILTLFNATSMQDITQTVFNHCATRASKNKKNHLLQPLLSQLEELLPLLDGLDDTAILCSLLQTSSLQQHLDPATIAVSDITHPLLSRKITYVVGVHQKNYPNFQARSGIFDEHYLSKTTFPTLQERLDAHNQQLHWIFNSAEVCHFIYPTMDYQGKEFEAAPEIKQLISEISPLPCLLLDASEEAEHKLQPELAQSLFLKENRLHGSVSSFEQYFNCPYSYFLAKGIKLKQPLKDGVETSHIGSIQHLLLEKLMRLPQWTSLPLKETLATLAAQPFDELVLLYPHEKDNLTLVKDRLIESISLALSFLTKLDKLSSFKPQYFEHTFEIELENHPITLKGIIDRIDILGDCLRIIDYKSSSKKLVVSNVKAGIQLQLLTYLSLAKKELNKIPNGAFYFSLKPETIKLSPLSIVDDYPFENFPILSDEHYIKKNRLNGWVMDEIDESDKELIATSGSYDMDTIEMVLDALFNEVYTRITDGNIALDPLKDACLYCKFKPVCRFKGVQKKPTPLVFADVPLKKGANDHEMES